MHVLVVNLYREIRVNARQLGHGYFLGRIVVVRNARYSAGIVFGVE